MLNYFGTEPYLAFIKTTVYDVGGNNNGRLDPGETVDLTSTLKNIGGVDFTDLSTTIGSSDPYVSISDNSGYFGFLAINTAKENTADPYVVTASPETPQSHSVEFRLIAMDGAFADTFNFNLIIGTDYLVWNPDPTPLSGEAIDSILTSLGYTGNYTITLPLTDLDIYQAIFVCVGVFPYKYTIWASDPDASALVDYLNNGGRMYLEGGDVWYYDPPVGYDFGPLFGINATADGSGDMGPVAGETETFTEGMNFNYSGENNWMDHIDPTGSGFLIFRDTDNAYNCGVANDIGTYRTVGTSFELGGLVDGIGVSTKAALLDSIMHFFGIHLIGVDEVSKSKPLKPKLILCPNPCRNKIQISYGINLIDSEKIKLKIYDTAGRLIKRFSDLSIRPFNQVIWDGQDENGHKAPAGIYFVRLETEGFLQTKKLVLLR